MHSYNLDQFSAIVHDRRSTRAFTGQRVDDVLLRRIFDVSRWAPSNCNTQPWHTAVVSGERCRALADRISAAMAGGDIVMDFPYDGSYQNEFRERQYGAAAALYRAMGIPREDKAARGAAFMRNFSFYDAPHVAFFFLPASFGLREACDLGMYAQTVMLALTAAGLGSCPQTALGFQAHIVREELGIGDDLKLLFGLSFGYADTAHASNRCRTDRADLDRVTTFYE